MKTTKKSQVQRLLAYMKKNRKGITVLEAFQHLQICCLHKRIAELEAQFIQEWLKQPRGTPERNTITRTREKTPGGATVTRYKLAK